jgi:hypothetical protein
MLARSETSERVLEKKYIDSTVSTSVEPYGSK